MAESKTWHAAIGVGLRGDADRPLDLLVTGKHGMTRQLAERVGFEPTEGLNTPHLLSRKALSTGLSHLSERWCNLPRVGRSQRSDGRVDEGGGLENRWPARVRGFESLSLR